jgi:hypothetical protein
VRPLSGIFRNTAPEEKKEESIPKKFKEIKHAEARTVSKSDHAETSKASESTMSSAKPLREFEKIDWVPVDFGEIFDKRSRGDRLFVGKTSGTAIQPRDNWGGPSKTL